MPTREPPPIWPQESVDPSGRSCTNRMPARELRNGDEFWIEGAGEVPFMARVVGVQFPPDRQVAFVEVIIGSDQLLGYVTREPQ